MALHALVLFDRVPKATVHDDQGFARRARRSQDGRQIVEQQSTLQMQSGKVVALR